MKRLKDALSVKLRLDILINEIEQNIHGKSKRDEIALLVCKEEIELLYNLYGFTRTVDSSLEYGYPSVKYSGYRLVVI